MKRVQVQRVRTKTQRDGRTRTIVSGEGLPQPKPRRTYTVEDFVPPPDPPPGVPVFAQPEAPIVPGPWLWLEMLPDGEFDLWWEAA